MTKFYIQSKSAEKEPSYFSTYYGSRRQCTEYNFTRFASTKYHPETKNTVLLTVRSMRHLVDVVVMKINAIWINWISSVELKEEKREENNTNDNIVRFNQPR